MTKEKILEALSTVQEPDLGKDLVTLNMVRDIVRKILYLVHDCADYSGVSTEGSYKK